MHVRLCAKVKTGHILNYTAAGRFHYAQISSQISLKHFLKLEKNFHTQHKAPEHT